MFLYTDALAARRGARHRARRRPAGASTVGLPERGKHTFVARDYDELVDSPFEVGTHELVEFDGAGQAAPPGHLGPGADRSREQLTADIIKIIDTAAALFADGVPYDDYTFLLMLAPNQYGGLEHAKSCALLVLAVHLPPAQEVRRVPRAHLARVLPPVERQAHPSRRRSARSTTSARPTRARLWVMEGVTSYYDRYLLVRAGLQKPDKYLEKLAEELGKIAGHPRAQAAVARGVELRRLDQALSARRELGQLDHLVLPEGRRRGAAARPRDPRAHRRQALARRRDAPPVGALRQARRRLPPTTTCRRSSRRRAASTLGAFFDRHVRGRDELDAERLLRTVGLQLTVDDDEDGGDDKRRVARRHHARRRRRAHGRRP